MDLSKKNFSEVSCKIMVNILNSPDNKHTTASSLARDINYDIHNPTFNNILKFLKENGGITVDDGLKPYKFLTLNKEVIKNIIDEMDIPTWWMENFWKPHHGANW